MKRTTAAVLLALLILLTTTVSASAAPQKWVCKPGWGNWKKTTEHHDEYTTFYPMFIGKSMIMQPMFHAAYDEDHWHCINYIHAENFNKYYDDGRLRPEFKDFDEWAKERKASEKNKLQNSSSSSSKARN